MAVPVPVPVFDRAQGLAIAADLATWYTTHARVLPWRVSPEDWAAGMRSDPYTVLLSEIVLQQTTVAVGKTRVPELLARFPTLQALPAAGPNPVVGDNAGAGVVDGEPPAPPVKPARPGRRR